MISLHNFVTDFVAVISSPSKGLDKMALGIVKLYLGSPFPANRRCSRSVGLRSVRHGQLSWTPACQLHSSYKMISRNFNLPSIDWVHLAFPPAYDDFIHAIFEMNFQHVLHPTRDDAILDLNYF